eukprot:GFUD01075743.1.p1 GENE.GFUD01075743.1~~GFUD01075743.1.p1  ORF type:complete len:215 (-),score=88.39 GFUD01075743.1:87-731(-)
MSLAVLLKVVVVTFATKLAMGQEYDLTASLWEESAVDDSPGLFKVIAKDSEGQFPVEEGWQLMEDENPLLYSDHFLDQFLDTPEMEQDFNEGNLAFVDGTDSIFLSLSGPDQAPSGSVLSFTCQSPPLHLIYPQMDLVWQLTNYSGEAVEFTINDSIEEEEEMTTEISLIADKEDQMLTVHCSLVSAADNKSASIDKFMQFDVQCKLIVLPRNF